MARTPLGKLIGRTAGTGPVLTALASAMGTPLAIEDAEGRLVLGAAVDTAQAKHPITFNGDRLGWVSGSDQAGAVATVLNHLLAKEAERKALGSEVLQLYRELNLIYSFSEKLAALLDVGRVAALTLQEARHLIVATDGVVMLGDSDDAGLRMLAGFGDELPRVPGTRWGSGRLGAMAAGGHADIVDDLGADPAWAESGLALRSLISAPLKVGERVTGVIVLGSTLPVTYTAGELKLLNTLALQTATAIESARLFERTVQAARERERLMALHQEAELAKTRLESELDLAARIQKDLFPSALPCPDGYDVAAGNWPARRCGGDYYDVLPLGGSDDDRRVLLCVADVSGKGMPAALLMSHMQATLRALADGRRSLPDLASQASELLYASTGDSKYVTAAMLDVDVRTGVSRYLSAGHVDSLLLTRDGRDVWLKSTGTPLGLLPPGMPYSETELMLAGRDVLILFSDGVTEAMNDRDEEFGEARLAEIARASAGESADTIVARVFDAIDRFAGAAPQHDDITLLVVKKLE
jgi:serine phosphatase RsbU (regulator of sigma subunit)